MAELELCDKVGIKGHDIVFSSNDTPYAEFKRAMELGALVNLDDISMIDFMEKRGPLPEWICARYNPGPLLKGGNDIIGTPEEAKYGMTREQIIERFPHPQRESVKHFGLHTMVVSNELHVNGLINTAKMMFELAVEVQNMLGINIEFLDFGGGIGLPYRPEESFIDYDELSAGIKKNFEAIMEPAGLANAVSPSNVAVPSPALTATWSRRPSITNTSGKNTSASTPAWPTSCVRACMARTIT